MTNNNSKVWLITGSSTGFGRSLSEAVLKQGDRVIATARKPEQLGDLANQYPDTAKAVRLDVTNLQEIQNAVNIALETFGQIDVLVNNAGYALLGAVEEVTDTDIEQQFATNFFGALNVTRAVLPKMRGRRSGHIVNITSIGGFVGGPGWGIYCATKFALEGLAECLALEVAHLVIHVTIVEPGAFRTNLGTSGTPTAKEIPDYAESSGRTREWRTNTAGRELGDPQKAVQAIIQVVESDHPPLRLVLGEDAVNAAESKLNSFKAEIDAWKEVALSTAFAVETGVKN